MVSSVMIAVLTMLGGLYIALAAQAIVLGRILTKAEENSKKARRNTELIHDHIIEGTNPHPKHDACHLCESYGEKRG